MYRLKGSTPHYLSAKDFLMNLKFSRVLRGLSTKTGGSSTEAYFRQLQYCRFPRKAYICTIKMADYKFKGFSNPKLPVKFS